MSKNLVTEEINLTIATMMICRRRPCSLRNKNVTNNSEIEDIVKTVTKTGTKPIDDGSAAAAQIDIILAFKVDLPSNRVPHLGVGHSHYEPNPLFFSTRIVARRRHIF